MRTSQGMGSGRGSGRTGFASRAAGGVLALAVFTASGLAQQAPEPVLLIEHADASAWMQSEHDAGLERAFGMLPARIAELPREIDDLEPDQVGLIRLALQMLSQRGTVAVTYNEADPSGGAFGYGVVFEKALDGPQQAVQLDLLAQRALDEADGAFVPEASERFPGLTEIQTPGALVSYGSTMVGDESVYRVIAGSVSDADVGRGMLPEPFVDGVEAVVRGTLNLAALTPGVRMGQAMAGPNGQEAAPFVRKLEEAGLIGEDAIKIDFFAGYGSADGAGHSVSGVHVHNARKVMDFFRMPDSPLTAKDFAAIPASADMAQMVRFDLGFADAMLDHAAELGAPIDDLLEEVQEEIGLDIRGDLLEAIGGTIAVYTAEASGEPFVALFEIKDRAAFGRFESSMHDLIASAKVRFDMPARYIQVDAWEHAGRALKTLRFPGLPVPVELTYTTVNDWIVLAPTAQGALFAANQAGGKGDGGLMASASLKGFMPSRTDMLSFTFYDTPERIGEAYPLMSLAGAAIGNAVRSPHADGRGADRNPGMVIPPLAELAEGARPIVQYSWMEGDAYRAVSTGDESLAVNVMGQTGGSLNGMVTQIISGIATSANR